MAFISLENIQVRKFPFPRKVSRYKLYAGEQKNRHLPFLYHLTQKIINRITGSKYISPNFVTTEQLHYSIFSRL